VPIKDPERRKENRRKKHKEYMNYAIEKLGGKCVKCNSQENLELDHIDPKTKIAKICAVIRNYPNKLEEELVKCQVLCKLCHREKSSKESRPFTHGTTYGALQKKCPCETCVEHKIQYRKNQREQKREDCK